MKLRYKIFCLVLVLLIAVLSVPYATAAKNDTAPVGASVKLAALEAGRDYYADLSEPLYDLPMEYNSAEEGYTLDIRTQTNSTCWAFGSLSSFETLLLKNGEGFGDYNIEYFSPQHANMWGTKQFDGTGWQRTNSDNGYSYISSGYLTSWSGPLKDTNFPMDTSYEDYEYLTSRYSPEFGVTSLLYLDSNTNRNSIKSLIYEYGSIVGNFNADERFLSSDKSGFYCSDSDIGISSLVGHCVSVIGWDDNYNRNNFSGSISGTPQDNGAWLCKNSWGKNANNIGGYYWISYEDVWIYNDAFGPSYVITGYQKIDDNVHLYQNEIYGATYEFDYLHQIFSREPEDISFLNVFDFTEDYPLLDKVIFESTSLGADYDIFYVPVSNGTPTSQTSLWTKLGSGTIDATGYICADFPDFDVPPEKGAIAVRLHNSNTSVSEYIPVSLGVDEWLSSGQPPVSIFTPGAERGLSYILYHDDGMDMTDIMDYYNLWDDSVGGTLVIKAIAKTEGDNPPVPTSTHTEPTTATVPTTHVVIEPTSTATDPTSTATDPTSTGTSPTSTATNPSSTVGKTEPTTATVPTTTTHVVIEPTSTFSNPFSYVVGDADLSGVVNIKDATLIQRHAAMIITMTPHQILAGDVNETGTVNVLDATLVQKFIAEMPILYGIGNARIIFE